MCSLLSIIVYRDILVVTHPIALAVAIAKLTFYLFLKILNSYPFLGIFTAYIKMALGLARYCNLQ